MIHVIQKVILVRNWMILHFRQPRHQAKLINPGYALLVINEEAQKFVTECTYDKQKIPFGKIWSSDSFKLTKIKTGSAAIKCFVAIILIPNLKLLWTRAQFVRFWLSKTHLCYWKTFNFLNFEAFQKPQSNQSSSSAFRCTPACRWFG